MHCHSVGLAHENAGAATSKHYSLEETSPACVKGFHQLGSATLDKLDRRKDSATSIHIYEIRPRADKHGFDLSSDALRYSPLWYRGPNAIRDAVRYAKSYSRSHPIVIRFYDDAGNVI